MAEKDVWSHWTTVSAPTVPRSRLVDPRRLCVAKPKAHDPSEKQGRSLADEDALIARMTGWRITESKMLVSKGLIWPFGKACNFEQTG